MDSQLEAVRQDIGSVKDEIVKTKQDLAAAEQAGNKEEKRVLLDLLLSLNNQLLSLQEEKNILLRSQTPSKPCLQLVHLGLPVLTPFALHHFCTSCCLSVMPMAACSERKVAAWIFLGVYTVIHCCTSVFIDRRIEWYV